MTPETHPIEKEQVMAYLDGELSSNDAQRVAAHLEGCAECRELAAELRELSSRMLVWDIEPAPITLSESVKATLERSGGLSRGEGESSRPIPVGSWRRLLSNRWVWATAVGLVCIAIGIGMGVRPKSAAMNAEIQYYFKPSSEDLKQASDSSPSGQFTAPMIARTASMKISTKDFDATRASMDRIVSAHHGFAASLSTSAEKGAPKSLSVKLEVPSSPFDDALSELRGLGRVEQEQQSGEEVTSQVVDIDARLKNAHETEGQLAEVLRTRAGKITDVLEVEKEMARVRGEIERMDAEQKQLRDRVAFALINLSLTEEYQAQLGDGQSSVGRQVRNAMVDGYHTATIGFLSIFVFFLSVGPSLILWALILLWPARWAWRRWRKSQEMA